MFVKVAFFVFFYLSLPFFIQGFKFGKSKPRNPNLARNCAMKATFCDIKNVTSVCAMRVVKDRIEYQDFENSCHLYFSNVCNFQGREYFIVSDKNCTQYFLTRRKGWTEGAVNRTFLHYTNPKLSRNRAYRLKTLRRSNSAVAYNPANNPAVVNNPANNPAVANYPANNSAVTNNPANNSAATNNPDPENSTNVNSTNPVLNARQGFNIGPNNNATNMSGFEIGRDGKPIGRNNFKFLYDTETAHDGHICPLDCPDVYHPVCLNVNRGEGKYFKYYTFVNHCVSDRYYCKHPEEFKGSPDYDEAENIAASFLGWSFCSSYRYMQFARFSEVASSLSHYGWLSGNYRYSHIMSPQEKSTLIL